MTDASTLDSLTEPPAPEWTRIDWRPHVRDEQIRGRRLRFVDYGEGPALLLVHGLGGSWQTWLENIPALGRDNRVIAVDLPGFGGSEALGPEVGLGDYVEALAGLIDHLGLERAFVAGHSLGGLICSALALAHPERLAGLILINAGGIAIGPVRLAAIVRIFYLFNAAFGRPGVMRAIALRPRLRRAMLSTFLRDWRGMSTELASETIPMMAAPGFVAAVAAGAEAAADPGAERITTPTLLIWGRHDRILPLSGAERLVAAMPDARLETLDAGHCPMFECAGEFNALVAGFARGRREQVRP